MGTLSDSGVCRVDAFMALFKCPMRKKVMERFTNTDLRTCIDFIKKHDHLGHADFNVELRNWRLDERDKPKKFFDMQSMLSETNAILFIPRRLGV